jgi:Ca-activated chloride channel family protein
MLSKILENKNMSRLISLTVLIAVSLFAITPSWANPTSSSEGKVILVLDASGSMWGQIKGKTKIEIARSSVASMVKEWKPGIELGLMTYGHRRKGDCKDIEMILPVGKVDPEAIIRIVNSINPKGKTPLSNAVRMAAEQLKFTEESATVILMSDGIETCNMDPCALGIELEKMGIDFTAHVIGFDLKREEQAKLSCLAENTGGLFLNAADAASLNKAFKKVEQEVIKAAPRKPEPKVEPGLKLVAVQVEGGKPVEGVSWTVTEPEPDINGSYKVIKAAAGTPVFKLASGNYRVAAIWGNATAEAHVNVDAEKAMIFQLVLNAGQIKLSATPVEGEPPLPQDVTFSITDAKPDIQGTYRHITGNYGGSPLFTLSAGTYRVQATWGNAITEETFDIVAGELSEKIISLNAGRIKLSSVPVEGEAIIPQDVTFSITDAKPDIHGTYRHITGNYGGSPLFTLSAGTYRVQATWGQAMIEDSFDIEAGKLTEKKISLNAGRVKLSAIPPGGTEPLARDVHFAITSGKPDINGNYRNIAANWGGGPVFTLSAGTYRVEITWKNRVSEATFEVKAGETIDKQILLE